MTQTSATRAHRAGESGVPSGLPPNPGSGCLSAQPTLAADEERRLSLVRPESAGNGGSDAETSPRLREAFPGGESEFSAFLESAAIGMHWLAPDGIILWANRTELSLLGYSRAQYVGHSMAEFFADPGRLGDLLLRLGSGQNLHSSELRLRCGDGAVRWFRIDASPNMREGKLAYAHCFLVDMSEKRRADEDQVRLAAIVESSDDAIASKDLNGIITSWNTAAERILGYKAEEIIGKSILTVIPPELHKDEPEILRKIQAGERIEHFETVRVTKAGERINVSLTVSPVRDHYGTIIGAAKILRDITEQKKLEAALRTTERLASVGRLAATVAHEINNPLEAVTNLLYLACQDPDLSASTRGCLMTADGELRRVAHIARQTLGFYRDTSWPVRISVAKAVSEILAIYDRRFQYKGIQVAIDIPADLFLCALQGELKQIISNLVSNAIDASPQKCRLSVRAWPSRHFETGAPGIRLVVADQGTGIPKAIRQKIFTPFFTTKRDVGTGLGLWIVRDLLLRRGGTILYRSRTEAPRIGTTMMVFLPSDEEHAESDSLELRQAAD
ncbi:MAG TPA: PAS domain S-box protein [Acidobacteriaceae bacterium]|jgi:PAS domain S-box-containing protein|nr:PAS domain S-box protein [Acidobacteriaceae bacterium]